MMIINSVRDCYTKTFKSILPSSFLYQCFPCIKIFYSSVLSSVDATWFCFSLEKT